MFLFWSSLLMKIRSKRYINIGKNVEYLGTEFATKLPQIHAVTGWDTTSFLRGVGKIKILKVSKWTRKTQASKNSWCFIQSFRNSNQRYWKVCLNCLLLWKRRIESTWNKGAAVTNKNKNQLLPPDEKSILQAIKRIHFEVYYW